MIQITKDRKPILPLIKIRQAVNGEFLFPLGRGGKDANKSIVKLNNAYNGAVRRYFVAGFRLYDLRHTFATRAAESGVDLVTLKDLLGHSRLDMVLRYAHPSEKHRFDAIRKIEEMQTARLKLKKAETKSIW